MLVALCKMLLRRKVSILFNDLNRPVPISNLFGWDRGLPIDRYYIERFIQSYSHFIKGEVIEVGGITYANRFAATYPTSCTPLHFTGENSPNAFVADLTDCSSLPESRYDCFICTQTLNFIFDVQAAIRGAYQLLKPGGTLLATVAGISQISRYDMDRWGDYWRFTTKSIEALFSPIFGANMEIQSHGNSLAACALLQGIALEDLPNKILLDAHDPDYPVIITIKAWKQL